MNRKLISMLSLCMKAGKLQSGEFSCEKAVKRRSAELVILAQDSSDNTKKKFTDKTTFYNIRLITISCSKEELGAAIGKGERAVVAVTDKGFAEQIVKLSE